MSKVYQDKFSINEDPEEMFNEWLDYRLYDLHTAHPARVVNVDSTRGELTSKSFNPSERTVTVQLCVQRDIKGISHAVSPLINVPVAYPCSSKYGMVWPIESGDEGMVIFSESSMDRWWEQTGENYVVNPEDVRMHSYSDGVFIPHIMRRAAALAEDKINDDELLIRGDGSTISVRGDEVTVTVGQTTFCLNSAGQFEISGATGDFFAELLRALGEISTASGGAGAIPIATLTTMLKV